MISIKKNQSPEVLLSPLTKQAINQLLSGDKKGLKKRILKDKSIAKSLQEAYNNKCAFCESILNNANTSTYRPKSKYLWLAYDWNNLMPICPPCNSNKRDKFPIQNRTSNKIPDEIKNSTYELNLYEAPLLLHPEFDKPEDNFSFTLSGEIISETKKGNTTIKICALNREFLQISRKEKIDAILQSFKNQIITLENFISKSNEDVSSLIKLTFTNIFDSLLKSAQAQAEFSLLGQKMIENFDYFFTNRIESESGREILKKAYQLFLKKETKNEETKIKQLLFQENDLLLTTFTNNKYFEEKNIEEYMPYALKSLSIENYNGIIKTEISDIPIDTRWIFLTGENGFGKTSVLQAIVLGLQGAKDKNIPLISEDNKVNKTRPTKIGLEIKTEDENVLNNIDSENFIHFANFAAYGPSRLNIFEATNEGKKTSQTYNIFNSDGTLLNIERELLRWNFTKQEEKADAVMDLLIKILNPYIVNILRPYTEGSSNIGNIIHYIEKDIKTDEHFSPKILGELASGFRSLISTIGDMLIRFERCGQDITQPEKLKGFVIIDEFDLHWHPKWQRVLVSRLSDIFKNIQFIVSTHSILPLIGAPAKSVFIKISKSLKNGIIMERINLDLKNLSPNIILSSPLFDTPLLSIENQNEEEFATDDDYIKWSAYEAVKKELKAKEQKRKDLFKLLNSKIDD